MRNNAWDSRNIELMSIKETYTESRKSSMAYEETDEDRLQPQKKNDCLCIPVKTIIWKTFKSIVFLICVIVVVIQSVEFYNIYREYPTTMVQKSTFINKVKLPALTLCFKYTVSTETFCYDNPAYCERPNNLEEICQMHPLHCRGDTSNLTIPTFYSNYGNYKRFLRERENYLFNDTFIDPLLYRSHNGTFWETRTYLSSGGFFYNCFSRNLHLYQSESKLETRELKFIGLVQFEFIALDQHGIELFDPPGNPQVFLGIHSPFIPINPVLNGFAIRSGYIYDIEVQLEREEHLLPPPYQTNCRDNGPSKDAKNFSNPNSYEMCLEMCESEFYRPVYNCNLGKTLHSSPSDLCNQIYLLPFHKPKLEERRVSCLQNCRPGCLKLHYNNKIKEDKLQGTDDVGKSRIRINFRKGEITSVRHVPLYGSVAMFSHIGGLLGYWLGISVFTFLDIIEKCFGAAIIWRRRFKKNKARKTQNSEDLV